MSDAMKFFLSLSVGDILQCYVLLCIQGRPFSIDCREKSRYYCKCCKLVEKRSSENLPACNIKGKKSIPFVMGNKR